MITFKPAKRDQASTSVIIGVIGPSGGGKTWSALLLARGLCPKGKRPAVIDTESGRALHYSDHFEFDHANLAPPFRPERYLEAIREAEKEGYPVIVVDSMSHEHAGQGGLLDWHDEELDATVDRARKRGDDRPEWAIREASKLAAWINPKSAHKEMIQGLLQVRAHIILCFRAEEKIKMEKDSKGKTQIVPLGWMPVCEKNIPYELTCSFILTPDKPGVPQPVKLQEQHRAMFPAGKPITEECGRLLAAWASGETAQTSGGHPAGTKPSTKAEPFVDPFPGVGDATLFDALMAAVRADMKESESSFNDSWAKLAFFEAGGKKWPLANSEDYQPDQLDDRRAKALRLTVARLQAAGLVNVQAKGDSNVR